MNNYHQSQFSGCKPRTMLGLHQNGITGWRSSEGVGLCPHVTLPCITRSAVSLSKEFHQMS
jgi:hypothetical protein